MRILAVLAVLALLPLATQSAEKPLVLELWPGQPPGEVDPVGEEKDMTKASDRLVAGKPVIRIGNVSKPTLTVYRPAKDKDSGAAVIVCPGGGYNILAWDLEGTEVCEWLNTQGITAILLKYRVPARKTESRHLAAWQDGQRAVSLVRSKAKEWGIDPQRIGILGFSAGGHLAGTTALTPDRRSYPARDDIDKVSCRPDFAVLIYPAYFVEKDGSLKSDVKITKDAPPMFLAHAGDDKVVAENSVQVYLALKRADVPTELHIYSTGGHGYGLRPTADPVISWNLRCAEWFQKQGVLKKQ